MNQRWWIHGGLLAATFVTTTLFQGPLYAVCVLAMLLGHELGHFFACRRYGVPATLPYFIPMLNIFGTMGAVIAIRGAIPSRKALFDIGIAGPLVGLALAIPAVALGIHFSEVEPTPTGGMHVLLGEPLLFTWLSTLIKGPLPESVSVMLHPAGMAGWVLIFVTAMNLFPAGQLDGGHILYAMVGPRRAHLASYLVIAALLLLGWRAHPMWYMFAVLVYFFSRRHPAPVDDVTPLDRTRLVLGVLAFGIMIICFSPVPIEILGSPG